jgi:polysaccharide export outer membrane protein
MDFDKRLNVRMSFATALFLCLTTAFAAGPRLAAANDYVVGGNDVLLITSYDQADLSGKFTVEADGTFTFPLIGRFHAGGLTLRAIEQGLKDRLREERYFKNPQITVAVEQYRSQKVFIVGEVRSPGPYTLSGNITLVEALARAGSTLPTAGSDAIVVHGDPSGPAMPTDAGRNVLRVDLRDLQNGEFSKNTVLADGDTVIVPRAESVYVFGQVKAPGAYALQQGNTTVLQALSLAGGVLDRGSTSRIRVVRMVNGEKKEIKVSLSDVVQPGDTIIVPERFL